MQRKAGFAFLAVAFAGCVVGSALATVFVAAPRAAHAQIAQPPRDQTAPNILNSDTLFVPRDGLRLVTEGNRTIGMIFHADGNAGLLLFDREGEQSVLLAAGTEGKLRFSGKVGSSLSLEGSDPKKAVRLTASASKSGVTVGGMAELSAEAEGGVLSINDTGGALSATLKAGRQGAALELFGKGKQKLVELGSNADGGSLTLRRQDGHAGFTAHGAGRGQISSAEETLWKVPED